MISETIKRNDSYNRHTLLCGSRSVADISTTFHATSMFDGESFASIRAMLKSVFPVREPRASLIIPRVSLNSAKNKPFAIYTYIRIRGVRSRWPGAHARVPWGTYPSILSFFLFFCETHPLCGQIQIRRIVAPRDSYRATRSTGAMLR
ncbi:hypothetical protein PUN28_005580 [Cardiocondyla obscurior]|uniref:Uncharacterized protein n=1 Tax=Cardiocondyla obscurior TaxID=286306 RepID=A0AAW2GMI3_9HYME